MANEGQVNPSYRRNEKESPRRVDQVSLSLPESTRESVQANYSIGRMAGECAFVVSMLLSCPRWQMTFGMKGRPNHVRRTLPFLRAAETITRDPVQRGGGVQGTGYRRSALKKASNRRVLAMDRWKPKSQESLDELLSSALLVQDKELAHTVHDVDEILKALKSDTPETQAVSNALKRTVLCALKQALLDKELRSLALTDDL